MADGWCGRNGPILLKKSVSNWDESAWPYEGPRLQTAGGLRLGEGLALVSASPAFGGFGRLLRAGTHRARRLVPVTSKPVFEFENALPEMGEQHFNFLAQSSRIAALPRACDWRAMSRAPS